MIVSTDKRIYDGNYLHRSVYKLCSHYVRWLELIDKQETMNLGFLLVGTHQQDVLTISIKSMLNVVFEHYNLLDRIRLELEVRQTTQLSIYISV